MKLSAKKIKAFALVVPILLLLIVAIIWTAIPNDSAVVKQRPVSGLSLAPAAARPLIQQLANENDKACRQGLPGTVIKGKKLTLADVPKYEDVSVDKVATNQKSIALSVFCNGGTGHFLVDNGTKWVDLGGTQFGMLDCATVNKYQISKSIFETGECFTDSMGHTATISRP